jgi:hypothetical protein
MADGNERVEKLTDNMQEAVEQVAKKHRNRADLANFGQEFVEPGDNSRYIRHAMATYNLPPIDISDVAQVGERINWYFNHCLSNDMKPTVTGLRNSLGVSKDTLANWRNERTRPETHLGMIKKAFDFLEELWEDYMQNGKINPVSGIFLGKNNFGYKDQQEYVLTPNNALGPDGDPATIEKKYRDALPPSTIDA